MRLQGTSNRELYLPESWVSDYLSRIRFPATFSFSGGEPFCHPDILTILDRTSRAHRVVLVTNGTLLTDETIQNLVKMAPKRFGGIGLTVLGISPVECVETKDFVASFENVRATLHRIREAKRRANRSHPAVNLKIVIRPENLDRLDSFRVFLREDLADLLTFQLQCDLAYPVFSDGQNRDLPTADRIAPPTVRNRPVCGDRETVERELDRLLTSPERKQGRLRFLPETTREELVRYLTGDDFADVYGCVFPWMAWGISPIGNAFLCRTWRPEPLEGRSISKAFNSENFRGFRRSVLEADLGRDCTGCCFLFRQKAAGTQARIANRQSTTS